METIGILTTTFYPERSLRFHLMCQMVGNATALGHSVTIVDGSPNSLVRDALSGFPRCLVIRQAGPGMGASRRQLFAAEAMSLDHWSKGDPSIFLWVEPEKGDIIRHIPALFAPIEAGEADIVLPARTDVGFASYPAAQATSEKAANAVFAEVTGKELDVMVGPVMVRKEMLPIFAACNPTQYGAADTYIQQIALMEAMHQGARVASVPIDFFYPAAQRHEEETVLADAMFVKRQRQFDDLTNGFRAVASALKIKR